jgi:dihydrofolate reductase
LLELLEEFIMRRVRYSVAMSLDGYIAGPDGEYDWIVMGSDAAAYFQEFYAQFDIAVMGRRTFEVFGGAVEGMRTYVFSRTLPPGSHKDVTVLGEDGLARLREMRAEDGKDIWLFGGGSLFASLVSDGLVDTVELGVMPVILGAGKPLMSGTGGRVKLRLIKSEATTDGVLSLNYAVEHQQ